VNQGSQALWVAKRHICPEKAPKMTKIAPFSLNPLSMCKTTGISDTFFFGFG